jgi:hypothetical protein
VVNKKIIKTYGMAYGAYSRIILVLYFTVVCYTLYQLYMIVW